MRRTFLTVLGSGLLTIAGSADGRSFISPMGEPFRDMVDGRAPPDVWFAGVDRNGDGRITLAEFVADARRFFALLDVNHDDEIGPEEIDRYEEEIAPEVRTGGGDGVGDGGESRRNGRGGGHRRGGGGARHGGSDEGGSGSGAGAGTKPSYGSIAQGAARFGYLDLPEPVIAADTDFNRGVSLREWVAAAGQRFLLLDANRDGAITADELPHLHGGDRPEHGGGPAGHRGAHDDGAPAARE